LVPPQEWLVAEAARLCASPPDSNEPSALADVRRHFENATAEWAAAAPLIAERLRERFGPCPEYGPERGQWFRLLKSRLPNPVAATVAATLAARQSLPLGALAAHLARARVADVDLAVRTLSVRVPQK